MKEKKKFLNKLLHSKSVYRKTSKTILQDDGDFINYSPESPRNKMFSTMVSFVPRREIEKYNNEYSLESQIIALYYYEPLLRFFRVILQSNPLFWSTDLDGSVYGAVITEQDSAMAWHFDEHSFSCVFVLQKPLIGGEMVYANMNYNENNNTDNIENDHHDSFRSNRPWNRMTQFFAKLDQCMDQNDNHIENCDIDSIPNIENSVYCFYGNTTLHSVRNVKGSKNRVVFVMAYSNMPTFTHSVSVNKHNQWGVHADINNNVTNPNNTEDNNNNNNNNNNNEHNKILDLACQTSQ